MAANTHIQNGLAAVTARTASTDAEERKRLLKTAVEEFLLALDDQTSNEDHKRIAHNRLTELQPAAVYGTSTGLYHKLDCPAKNITYSRNYVSLAHWRAAEARGYRPCGQCKPHPPESAEGR